MADPKTYRVITLPEPLHAYLTEIVGRVVTEGLLVPDELPYTSALWEKIKTAQVVEVPQAPAVAAAPEDEGGAHDRP